MAFVHGVRVNLPRTPALPLPASSIPSTHSRAQCGPTFPQLHTNRHACMRTPPPPNTQGHACTRTEQSPHLPSLYTETCTHTRTESTHIY
eukprot:jgi/Botrbrau1/18908/Bobra.177_2s0065.1